MSLSDKFYRFKSSVFRHWGERVERESEVLGQLRLTPGFQALLDVFDAEIRGLFLAWSRPQKAEDAEALRQKAIAIFDMMTLLEGATTAKARQDEMVAEAERQVGLMHTDRDRRRAQIEQSRRQAAASV